MHTHKLEHWQHEHDFSVLHEHGERRTLQVLFLTATMMIIEVVAGVIYGSMALLADGWHMGTHAAAFMITVFAYRYARRHSASPAFAFGTGKVSVLGGFASAVALAVVALVMLAESAQRLFTPHVIHFNEAIGVAVLGLAINIISALLLQDHHVQEAHNHHHAHHHDHNLKAAYLHVLADALVSVLAIGGLLAAKFGDWAFVDPLVGLVGSVVIVSWSIGLARQSGGILIDAVPDRALAAEMRQRLEANGDAVSDLHLWRVGPGHYAAMVSILSGNPEPPQTYKDKLGGLPRLSHVTVEVERCPSPGCGR